MQHLLRVIVSTTKTDTVQFAAASLAETCLLLCIFLERPLLCVGYSSFVENRQVFLHVRFTVLNLRFVQRNLPHLDGVSDCLNTSQLC